MTWFFRFKVWISDLLHNETINYEEYDDDDDSDENCIRHPIDDDDDD